MSLSCYLLPKKKKKIYKMASTRKKYFTLFFTSSKYFKFKFSKIRGRSDSEMYKKRFLPNFKAIGELELEIKCQPPLKK